MASLLFNFEWDIPLFWRFGASFKWQAGSFVLDNKWNLSRCNPASNFERIIWDNRGKPIQIIETWHCSFSHKGLPSSRIKGVSNITKKCGRYYFENENYIYKWQKTRRFGKHDIALSHQKAALSFNQGISVIQKKCGWYCFEVK